MLKELTSAEKKTFLNAYREHGWDWAVAALRRTEHSVQIWLSKDLEFKREFEAERETRRLLLGPRMDDLTDLSLGVMRDTLKGKAIKPETRLLAATTHLKGDQVYSDKSKVDLQVKEFQITVKYADSDKGTDGNTPQTP